MIVDTHAHVYTADLPLASSRRYTPEVDHPPEEYLGLLDAHGVTHGVIIAASFLGTYSDYTLAALAQHPERLRATVIVDPQVPRATLEDMDRGGVTGVRFNWLGMDPLPDIRSPSYRRLLDLIAGLGWHVELHVEGERLAPLVETVIEHGADLVIDHFGLPAPAAGIDCEGFRAVRDSLQGGRTWVKLSAPYRLRGLDPAPLATVLLAEAGPGRLLWGSDWPWTQNDGRFGYADTRAWLEDWVPEAASRELILGETPRLLYRFDRPVAALRG